MMKKLHPIMFVGTGSDVGKSIVNAGFCRVFKQDGYTPAPFKAQNMSLNSFATPDGLEIGRAQAVQAEASKVDPQTDMNPVLLKPSGDMCSQVVLNGKPVGNRSAYDYFRAKGKDSLFHEVTSAFDRLETQYNPIVMEGAGSISEINLRERDIVNMRMAIHADAVTYLVADIDRGGVFASVYGSLELLTPEERKQVKGIIINKFRGDIRLFEDGKTIIEDLCKVPVVGILPYFKDIYIEDEDSVALEKRESWAGSHDTVNIAVVLLRHMSNFTDFNVLERDPRVHLFYTHNTDELNKADIVIVPGSKNTIEDLLYLRKSGVGGAILRAAQNGKTVIGICGGYQILGKEIRDPKHNEGDISMLPGLGLLPIITTIEDEKVTKQSEFTFMGKYTACKGYEIHMGESEVCDGFASPLNIFDSGKTDGYLLNDKCWGTYMHGILDNQVVIDQLLKPYTDIVLTKNYDHQAFKEEQYERLAQWIRENVDMELVYDQLGGCTI
ncbi:MAG: cobyric acid synthase [Bacteroidales bacterium]|nr:cobyric acid synthase [Bacteroidales bacterium]